MDYGFNDFQCRYYEHYQADVDFANYTPKFQRWHDFLNALPGPPLPLVFSSSQGSVAMSAVNGSAINITLSATGGTAPYSVEHHWRHIAQRCHLEQQRRAQWHVNADRHANHHRAGHRCHRRKLRLSSSRSPLPRLP